MAKCYDNFTREELIELLNKQDKELALKKYGLVWDSEKEPEKVVLDCENNLPILQRISDKEIKTDNSDYNILIEGDNFHALSVLNYTHKGKIDVIYIDPPYNTGNKDFKYNDSYVDKEDGYRHSKWLNFMEKRLNLAKNLLKEEGIIFISIDDNEQANLKLICDKIFGENNQVAILPTVMNLKGNQDEFGFAGTHEYTFVYAINKSSCHIGEFKIEDDEINDWDIDEKGYFKKGANLVASGVNAPRKKRPNLFYPVFLKDNKIFLPATDEVRHLYDRTEKKFNDEILKNLIDKYKNNGYIAILPISNNNYMSWRWQLETMQIRKDTDIIINNTSLYKKQRPELSDLPSKKPKTIFYKPEYSSGNGTNRLKELFGSKIFNNPKPVELIKDLVYLGGNRNITVLDFTAGSGTTADAIIQLNKEDMGKRKFILCTNNENNICTEVCYPRIEKVINGYNKNGNGEFIEGLGGNLQYFKTAYIENSENIEQLKVNLTYKCTEMLCLKENIYNLKKEKEDYKIFESNKKDKYLCVYYNFINDSFEDFLNTLKKLEGQKIIYMFSMDGNVNNELFEDIDNFKIETIPQKILDIYKKIIKENVRG